MHPRFATYLAAILAAMVGPSPGAAVAADARAAARPNIVFILADDLGYGDLGCYGQAKIKTPHLDRMAAEGTRFTQCYAGSTVCAPSRCVLMTGLHTGHALVRGNAEVPLRPDDVTVAEVLKAAGYRTALIGKWGLGEAGSTGVPGRQGFDSFFGYLNQVHAHNYYPAFLWQNDAQVALRNEVQPVGKSLGGVATKRVEYSHDLFVERALALLEADDPRPLFLYLALTIPHANNEAGREGMEVPDLGAYAERDWPAPEKARAAMVARMDADVGRLLATLKARGLDERTIVFFSSDNGPHSEGGVDPTFLQSSGPLRGQKRSLHEGGIRVPMIVRWPGRVGRGTNDHVWAFWDVLPTLAELAGGAAPPGLDGLSVAPTLVGGRPQPRHEFLYWEFHEGDSQQAVRMGDWKAIRRRPGATLELYDLAADLHEHRDVAAGQPAVVARIEAYLATARTASDDWPLKARPRRKQPAGQRARP